MMVEECVMCFVHQFKKGEKYKFCRHTTYKICISCYKKLKRPIKFCSLKTKIYEIY